MDSSVAGIGGCPYAKGASGNIATEDVVFLCELLGLDHGINIPRLLEVGEYISTQLQRTNLARVRGADLGIVADLRKDLI
jgi:hydroxymethylglutaryl-CoA lyase